VTGPLPVLLEIVREMLRPLEVALAWAPLDSFAGGEMCDTMLTVGGSMHGRAEKPSSLDAVTNTELSRPHRCPALIDAHTTSIPTSLMLRLGFAMVWAVDERSHRATSSSQRVPSSSFARWLALCSLNDGIQNIRKKLSSHCLMSSSLYGRRT
jgi:hypothetical protein